MADATTIIPGLSRVAPAIVGFGVVNKGMIRTENEDSILVDPDGEIWAVADGMGGHGHGAVASEIAVDEFAEIADAGSAQERLFEACRRANDRILAEAHLRNVEMMGSTVVAALFERAIAHICWMGDSRAYLMRGRRLRLLTADHSVVNELLAAGSILPADIGTHPEAHVITKALGGDRSAEPDFIEVPVVVDDRFLLCSDGLTRSVLEPEIESILAEAETPRAACRNLLEMALDAGAPDNVSAVVIHAKRSD